MMQILMRDEFAPLSPAIGDKPYRLQTSYGQYVTCGVECGRLNPGSCFKNPGMAIGMGSSF
jgi:hypothetical protein